MNDAVTRQAALGGGRSPSTRPAGSVRGGRGPQASPAESRRKSSRPTPHIYLAQAAVSEQILSAKEVVSRCVVQCQTHRRLCILVQHLAEDKDGDVVLSEIPEDGIGDMSNLATLDSQSSLLQCLSLRTLYEVFAILKMSTREGPLSWTRLKVSKQLCHPWR